MNTRNLARSLATASLLALATMASPVLQGDAMAAKKESSAPAPAGGTSVTTERTTRPGTTNPRPVMTGGVQQVKPKSAGPTGQGPADAAECDRWADAINGALETATDWLDRGDVDQADAYASHADYLEDNAMDRGCFIVN